MACLREFVRVRMQGQNSSFARPQRRAFRPLARRDVIYTIMSDEQQRQRPKGPRPLGLQRKSPPGSSKGSTVLPIRSSPSSCPDHDFGGNAAHGNNEF